MGKGGENTRHLLLCGKWLDIINTSEMVQGTLDTLTRVFDRVGLQTNVGDMVGFDVFSLPHSMYPVGGGSTVQYDEVRTYIPVPSETAGPMSRICSGSGGKFACGAP